MINSIYKVANNFKDKVNNIVEYQMVLKECTSNENWNVSNSKLQILADHSYNWDDYTVIMKHLWTKLNSRPKDWRRIFKTLNAMDYLIKNGAPRCIQDIKDDLYKIRSLQDFSYSENGADKGQGVRDKSRAICELLSDSQKLQEEREFARRTRDKFSGISSTSSAGQGYAGNSISSAAPASGKYGGFGSEDIHRFGYKAGQFNAPYDPYEKTSTIAPTVQKESKKNKHQKEEVSKKKSKKHKKSKKAESDSESEDSEESSDESSSSSDSEDEKPKKKSTTKKSAGGLAQVPKPKRQIEGTTNKQSSQQQPATNGETAQTPNLIDLLEAGPPPQQNQNHNSAGSGFSFLNSPAQQQEAQPQQSQSLFANMSVSSPPQQTQPSVQSQLDSVFSGLNLNTNASSTQNAMGTPNPSVGLPSFNMPQTQSNQNNMGPFSGMSGGGFNPFPSQPQQQMQFPGGFGSNPAQQWQQKPQQQPANQNMFANMNMGQSNSSASNFNNVFSGFQSNQPQTQAQPFQQPQQQPFQNSFNLQGSQTQSTGAFQNNNSFNMQPKQQPEAKGNFSQKSNSSNKNDVWSEGSGLFNLNDLKSGDKNVLQSQQRKPNAESGNNLLHSNLNDLDSDWTSSFKTPQGSQGIRGQQSFAQHNIQQPINSNLTSLEHIYDYRGGNTNGQVGGAFSGTQAPGFGFMGNR